MKKAERDALTIALWEKRPPEERTMHHVGLFANWLYANRPELLPPDRYGDPYQQLKSVLRGRIVGS